VALRLSRVIEEAKHSTPKTPGEGPALRWVPKEHGASFMSVHALLLGIIAGFTSGGSDLVGLLLALALGVLVLPISGAVSVWSHPKLAAKSRRRAGGLAVVFAAIGGLALLHGPSEELLAIGAAAAALAGGYSLARTRKGPRSTPAQLAAIACISLLAPLAWLLIAGPTDGWQLSAPVAFLSFGASVPYVRERVRRRRFKTTTLGERLRGGALPLAWQAIALLAALASTITGMASALLPVAFLPGAAKTVVVIARAESRPPLKRIGYQETALSTVFAVLAGIGLGIGPA